MDYYRKSSWFFHIILYGIAGLIIRNQSCLSQDHFFLGDGTLVTRFNESFILYDQSTGRVKMKIDFSNKVISANNNPGVSNRFHCVVQDSEGKEYINTIDAKTGKVSIVPLKFTISEAWFAGDDKFLAYDLGYRNIYSSKDFFTKIDKANGKGNLPEQAASPPRPVMLCEFKENLCLLYDVILPGIDSDYNTYLYQYKINAQNKYTVEKLFEFYPLTGFPRLCQKLSANKMINFLTIENNEYKKVSFLIESSVEEPALMRASCNREWLFLVDANDIYYVYKRSNNQYHESYGVDLSKKCKEKLISIPAILNKGELLFVLESGSLVIYDHDKKECDIVKSDEQTLFIKR